MFDVYTWSNIAHKVNITGEKTREHMSVMSLKIFPRTKKRELQLHAARILELQPAKKMPGYPYHGHTPLPSWVMPQYPRLFGKQIPVATHADETRRVCSNTSVHCPLYLPSKQRRGMPAFWGVTCYSFRKKGACEDWGKEASLSCAPTQGGGLWRCLLSLVG